MGDPAIVRNSDYRQYAKDPKIREGAQQRFVRPEGSEGGTPTTVGHVARKGGFNWRDLSKFDTTYEAEE